MKIRIVKASGQTVELSDVAGIEVIECTRMRLVRYDRYGPAVGQFNFELCGDGASVLDANLPWPFPPVVVG
jgi:hypothetical protein